jgi:dipeptidase E
MAKLVLYGGGYYEDCEDLNSTLIRLTNKKSPSIGFIPAESYGGEEDYYSFVDSFSKLGVRKILYFPLDREFSDIKRRKLLDSDAIFLGGGNTFYFLYWLKKTKLFNELKKFVAKGKVLAGMSAGAILCNDNILMASVPAFDRDENEVNIRNWSALKLTPFYFFPHFKNSNRYINALKILSNSTKQKPIIATKDGAGLSIIDDLMTFHGELTIFLNGQLVSIKI